MGKTSISRPFHNATHTSFLRDERTEHRDELIEKGHTACSRTGQAKPWTTAAYATAEILKPRAEWLKQRRAEAERTGDTNMSQMHFARLGHITEEMEFVAKREKISSTLIP